jgi:alpha-glucosidase (family GH31 glycosyl hydrolase)
MPAPWLFGIQVSRHSRTKEFGSIPGIEAMIEKMQENDFPWDAIIAEGWHSYNTDSYDDLRKIIAKVHSIGKKFLLYEPCGRVPHSDDPEHQAKIEKNQLFKAEYVIKEPDGNYLLPENWKDSYNPADHPNPKRVPFVDITNPKALEWWQGHVWGTLIKDIGADGCKIDFCEQVPDHMPLVFHDGRSSSGAHQWYPTLYNTLMYRFYQKHHSEGGMCFSRGGGIGAQRYPFLWAGDQRREFSFLQAVLTSILSSGLSGIPFMSYDMSGYWPAMNGDPEDAVFIRGTEMSCFSSNMQTHGFVSRPYDFPEPIKDIYRVYAKLHQAMRPYLLEQADYACQTGTPLLRHLFLYDPKDPKVFDIEDEYMLGSALLVAPVFKPEEKRDIYLPQGTWRNILDGKSYSGNQSIKDFPVPFQQIPVFVLEGNNSTTINGVLKEAESLLGKLR